MKKIIYTTISLLLIVFLIACPAEAFASAKDGMGLWLNVMIPTLLPFLILTGILIRADKIQYLLSPLRSVWKLLFGLSPAGAYAFIFGMLCGYPMGAKITSDLYRTQKIGKNEAEYLLTFANMASPVFVHTYVVHICLRDSLPFGTVMAVLLCANGMVMLLFRFGVFQNNTVTLRKDIRKQKKTSTLSSSGAFLDASIMNGFETITRLGGYILMFSVLSAALRHFWKPTGIPGYLLPGILELTTGIHQLQSAGIQLSLKGLLAMFMTSFGGICIMAQTRSLVSEELSLRHYMTAKLLNGIFTVILLLFAEIV